MTGRTYFGNLARKAWAGDLVLRASKDPNVPREYRDGFVVVAEEFDREINDTVANSRAKGRAERSTPQ